MTELRFAGAGDLSRRSRICADGDLPIFLETRRWLDTYFNGRQPDFTPPLKIAGMTHFRRDVLEALLTIPFGRTTTYGAIAATLARKRGMEKISAQAVGGAVGWNPVCIIIPCHRVIGAARNLTGYGGGMGNKIALLAHEGHDMKRFNLPRERKRSVQDAR